MEKIFKFLDENIEGTLATVEGEKPRIRVFQIMKRADKTLFFATSAHKHVYSELTENPCVEFMSWKGNVFVRVAGKADFSVDDETQQEIFRNNAVLQRIYGDYRKLVYFKVDPEAIEYFDLSPTPPISEYYDFRKQ